MNTTTPWVGATEVIKVIRDVAEKLKDTEREGRRDWRGLREGK